MRRLSPWLVLLLVLPACALADGAPPTVDSGIDFDGSAADAGTDGGSSGTDGGPGSDSMMPPADADEFDTAIAGALATDQCFDGNDNDDDGFADCADASCQMNIGSCCVGASSAFCCDDGTPTTLTLAGCSGDLDTCVDPTEVIVFGSPEPGVRTLGGRISLLPGGQTSTSGAVFTRTFDPRLGGIRVRAQIASPETEPASGAVETLGVGFVDATIDPSMIARVAPVAGVLVSRNRNEVQLVIAGEVVQTWPLGTEGPVDYTLELETSGEVIFGAAPEDGSVGFGGRTSLRTTRPLRAVVYGRTANPDSMDPPPTRLLELEITPRACDMPAALTRTSAPVVPAPLEVTSWADMVGEIARPHVIRYEEAPGTETVRMVLMIDGEVHLAEPGLGGFVLLTPLGEPALIPPAAPWASDGVDHPALRWVDGELQLWFTGFSGGRGTVATASWDGMHFVSDGPMDGLTATSSRGYAAAVPFDRGTPHVVVRVDDDITGQRIQLFELDIATVSPSNVVYSGPGDDLFAFDRDEIGSLAVAEQDGVLRVYYAGRRGTRWSIGVLASSDAAHWHDPTDGLVLGASNSGFDALGVRDPAIDIVGGVIELYYAGDDGTRTRIGRALGATL